MQQIEKFGQNSKTFLEFPKKCQNMSPKTVVKLINYDQKFLDFLDFFLQENSLFFSFLTRNQKPRKMPCVVSTMYYFSK